MPLIPPQPRDFYVYASLDDERGGVVFEKEIYMKRVVYDVNVVDRDPTKCAPDDQFLWGYTVRYGHLGPDAAKAIENAANGIAAAAQANRDDAGDLTATLTATVDGVAQKPLVYHLTRESLTKVQRKVWENAKDLLDATEQHAKKHKVKGKL